MPDKKDNGIKFWLPGHHNWKDARLLRTLRPSERHAHFVMGAAEPADSMRTQVLCTGSDTCPICQMVKHKRPMWIRFCVLLQDIGAAFKAFARSGRVLSWLLRMKR